MVIFLPDGTPEEREIEFKALLKRAQGPRNLAIVMDAVLDMTKYGFTEEQAKAAITIVRLRQMVDTMVLELETRKVRNRKDKKHSDYSKVWRIVEGAVNAAFTAHPDYLTDKGRISASASVIKRVTGAIVGFAEQSAKSRSR